MCGMKNVVASVYYKYQTIFMVFIIYKTRRQHVSLIIFCPIVLADWLQINRYFLDYNSQQKPQIFGKVIF